MRNDDKCPYGYEYVKPYRKKSGETVSGYCREAFDKLKLPNYKGEERFELPDGRLVTREGKKEYVLWNYPGYDEKEFGSKKEVRKFVKEANENHLIMLKSDNSMFKDYLKQNNQTPREYEKQMRKQFGRGK